MAFLIARGKKIGLGDSKCFSLVLEKQLASGLSAPVGPQKRRAGPRGLLALMASAIWCATCTILFFIG